MPEAIASLVFLTAVILYFFIRNYILLRRSKRTVDLVSWCIVADSSFGSLPGPRASESFHSIIRNTQTKNKLSSPYTITSDSEWEHVSTIISAFQEALVQSFFKGQVSYNRTPLSAQIYGSEEEHFFMFQLFCYLANKETASSIGGNSMHSSTNSYESHGTYGKHLYSASYTLSDFGITFYKLQHIVYLYCSASPIYQKSIAFWLSAKHYTEIIDSKQINISSM